MLMALSVENIVEKAVAALHLELVEVERAPRGLLRVFIDRPAGKGAVTVEDCAAVSNQLTHIFTVESIDYDRLEVSSPGLDRVLKTVRDFERFAGQLVRVRLNTLVDGRKRFDGTAIAVGENAVTFSLQDDDAAVSTKTRLPKKTNAANATNAAKKSKEVGAVAEPKTIVVTLAQIEKARLVPDL